MTSGIFAEWFHGFCLPNLLLLTEHLSSDPPVSIGATTDCRSASYTKWQPGFARARSSILAIALASPLATSSQMDGRPANPRKCRIGQAQDAPRDKRNRWAGKSLKFDFRAPVQPKARACRSSSLNSLKIANVDTIWYQTLG